MKTQIIKSRNTRNKYQHSFGIRKSFYTLFLGILLLGFSTSSCSTSSVMSTSNTRHTPTDPRAVEIYFSDVPEKAYEEIGKVSVDKYSPMATKRSGEKVQELLKEMASSIGGHAVINITEDFASMSGVVIRYTE